jgi:hypothetical protein
MHRRLFLSSLATVPILVASPAFAGWDEGVAAVFNAGPGQRARVTRTRSGFLLEVSGARFNIGMPPAAQLAEVSVPSNNLLQFEIQMASTRLTAQIDGLRRFRVSKAGGNDVAVSVRGEQGLRALTDTPEGLFTALVGAAAATMQRAELGRGGDAFIMGDGISMLGNFEIQD